MQFCVQRRKQLVRITTEEFWDVVTFKTNSFTLSHLQLLATGIVQMVRSNQTVQFVKEFIRQDFMFFLLLCPVLGCMTHAFGRVHAVPGAYNSLQLG